MPKNKLFEEDHRYEQMGKCMFLFMYVFQEKGGWVVVDIVLKFNCT